MIPSIVTPMRIDLGPIVTASVRTHIPCEINIDTQSDSIHYTIKFGAHLISIIVALTIKHF